MYLCMYVCMYYVSIYLSIYLSDPILSCLVLSYLFDLSLSLYLFICVCARVWVSCVGSEMVHGTCSQNLTYQQIPSKAVQVQRGNIFEHHAAAAAAATAKAPPGQHGILMDIDGYQLTTALMCWPDSMTCLSVWFDLHQLQRCSLLPGIARESERNQFLEYMGQHIVASLAIDQHQLTIQVMYVSFFRSSQQRNCQIQEFSNNTMQ